jgi:hypothetical protein
MTVLRAGRGPQTYLFAHLRPKRTRLYALGHAHIPGLAHYGMTAADVPALVARANAASSMRGNPIALTDDELAQIAERSLFPEA